jgi:hypothetical protein
LFYVSMPKGAMRAAWQEATAEAERRGDAVPVPPVVLGIEVDAFGLFAAPATLTLDAGACAGAKLRAIRCHQSQVAGDALGRLPDEAAARALGLELYRRAPVGAQGATFIDRMARPA